MGAANAEGGFCGHDGMDLASAGDSSAILRQSTCSVCE